MYDFIVLGLVPGTNIQITFEMYTTAMLSLLAAVLIVRYSKKLYNLPLVIGDMTLRFYLQYRLFHR